MSRRTTVLTLTTTISLAALACGGGDDSGDPISGMITADEGGTVSLDGSGTRLSFPANSVASDTEVTLSMSTLSDFEAYDDAVDDVLVIAPFMVLEVPAELTLDIGDQIDPTARLSVIQFIDGTWIGLEASAQLGSGGLITTSIMRLAPTAIVARAAPEGDTGTIEGQALHIYTEEPLSGITFNLIANDTIVDSQVSASDGTFTFENAPVGEQIVSADVDEANNCYGDPTTKEVTVEKDETANIWFGFVPGPC